MPGPISTAHGFDSGSYKTALIAAQLRSASWCTHQTIPTFPLANDTLIISLFSKAGAKKGGTPRVGPRAGVRDLGPNVRQLHDSHTQKIYPNVVDQYDRNGDSDCNRLIRPSQRYEKGATTSRVRENIVVLKTSIVRRGWPEQQVTPCGHARRLDFSRTRKRWKDMLIGVRDVDSLRPPPVLMTVGRSDQI
nr:hypothetical protein CFP56_75745 [Quercus suber]